MSEEHASSHVKDHRIRTLVFCGTVILPFLSRALCKTEKLDLDLERMKKHTIKVLI